MSEDAQGKKKDSEQKEKGGVFSIKEGKKQCRKKGECLFFERKPEKTRLRRRGKAIARRGKKKVRLKSGRTFKKEKDLLKCQSPREVHPGLKEGTRGKKGRIHRPYRLGKE